jgi:hypothetical protein
MDEELDKDIFMLVGELLARLRSEKLDVRLWSGGFFARRVGPPAMLRPLLQGTE